MASVLEAPTLIVYFLTHNSGRLGEPIYRLTTVSLYFLPTLSEAELQIESASSPASNMLKIKKNRSGSLPRTIFFGGARSGIATRPVSSYSALHGEKAAKGRGQ